MDTRLIPSTLRRRTAILGLAAAPWTPGWAQSGGRAPIKAAGVYTVPFEQQWVSRVHQAMQTARQRGAIQYKGIENIPAHRYADTVRKQAEQGYKLIIGEAFEAEEAVRKVAAEFPGTAIVMGSSGKLQAPNFSVFDNYIHEPSYLAGMLAGGMTRSNHIGLLGGMAIPEVNRLMNAFIDGAREVNPRARFSTGVINSWLNQPRARQMTMAMVDQGVDAMFAATMAGVIETAAERNILAFGNIIHPQPQYPNTVVASALWHMEPTVDAVIAAVQAGTYQARDLASLSFMRAKGASLSPLGTFERKVAPELLQRVRAKEADILSGRFVVPIKDEIELTLR
ncbi:BMP family ABC transporter substrate-binding protein [Comamonas serinivorans]|uniref:BMP family ABC transporter substrate-binding protein n=1 Tax=Comamonas serinivorans TaxID=1082851 RepID=A0A1Y0EJT4_9BURK|nr:BMP family protein [Comamonas serinivorans]ARU03542.1 BMP family ABC transporter substrate-binding protein [Comamonas serinivorans]